MCRRVFGLSNQKRNEKAQYIRHIREQTKTREREKERERVSEKERDKERARETE